MLAPCATLEAKKPLMYVPTGQNKKSEENKTSFEDEKQREPWKLQYLIKILAISILKGVYI